jgi:uncharacterized membrane protein
MKSNKNSNFFKYVVGLITVLFIRLLPRPPNVEPVMSTMMPFAKRWGKYAGLLFSALAIILFDVVTGTIGYWSIMTVASYSLLGFIAGIYFTKKRNKTYHFVGFAIIGTIIYDAITGIGTGILFFNMPLSVTVAGQIPFTLYHLAGNIVLSATISPLLYKWVVKNPNLETTNVLNFFKHIVKVKQ